MEALMALWLFKEEPEHYSFADLQRAGETVWDGVSNNLALKHLRQVKKGDRILFYHTGKEKAIVGEMKAVADAEAPAGDPKAAVVRVKPIKRWKHPVSLERIKQEPSLADWELVRISRLSIMPLTEVQWRKVEEMSNSSE
jgi:predicted RNA-binding protein with PUA-like domain